MERTQESIEERADSTDLFYNMIVRDPSGRAIFAEGRKLLPDEDIEEEVILAVADGSKWIEPSV